MIRNLESEARLRSAITHVRQIKKILSHTDTEALNQTPHGIAEIEYVRGVLTAALEALKHAHDHYKTPA